jgi:hypothetical protein
VALIVRRITGEASPEITAMLLGVIEKEPGWTYAWPGNVRELEQAVRRILLTRHYRGDDAIRPDRCRQLQEGIAGGTLDAGSFLYGYCALLYERHGTYEEVARRTGLDRRTVKSCIERRASEDQISGQAAAGSLVSVAKLATQRVDPSSE